jgi:hypothetical protein
MIGFITVTISKGEVINGEQLRGLAQGLYPTEAASDGQHHSSDVQRYINDLPSVYTCIPRNASRATFLWQGAQSFEVVVEAQIEGRLIATVEGIVRSLRGRLPKAGITAEIRVELKDATDWRTYLDGEPATKTSHFWRVLQPNAVAISIAVIIAVIARFWLTQYYEEAIASIIALGLFTIYTLFAARNDLKHGPVHWTVNERLE